MDGSELDPSGSPTGTQHAALKQSAELVCEHCHTPLGGRFDIGHLRARRTFTDADFRRRARRRQDFRESVQLAVFTAGRVGGIVVLLVFIALAVFYAITDGQFLPAGAFGGLTVVRRFFVSGLSG